MKVLFLIHRDPESLVIFVTGLLLIIEQRINPTWNTNVYYEYLYTDINNSFLPFISKRFYPVSLQIRVPANFISSNQHIKLEKERKEKIFQNLYPDRIDTEPSSKKIKERIPWIEISFDRSNDPPLTYSLLEERNNFSAPTVASSIRRGMSAEWRSWRSNVIFPCFESSLMIDRD